MHKYKVAFCQFPGNGISRMETNAWVVRTVREMDRDPGIEAVVSLTYNDTPIPMLRNRAVLDARAACCAYLLMVDSDMAPDLPYPGAKPFWETAWAFMMERQIAKNIEFEMLKKRGWHDGAGFGLAKDYPPATIAAPYCGPSPNQCVYAFQWTCDATGKPNPGFKLEMVPRESAAIRCGIQEVAALPTGLILYDMRVFDVLPPPWFQYEYDALQSEKHTTEDVYQTRNAGLLGLPQYVAWDCWAGHIKTEVVPKPMLYTRDHVHRSLRDAVLRGVDGDDRLVFVGNGDGATATETGRKRRVACESCGRVDDSVDRYLFSYIEDDTPATDMAFLCEECKTRHDNMVLVTHRGAPRDKLPESTP